MPGPNSDELCYNQSMKSKTLEKYLGKSIFKKDFRKEEIINDKIDLGKWENNMRYATEVPSFDSLILEDYHQKIISNSTPAFINIIANLRSSGRVIYFPEMLWKEKWLWYFAAYPDVINYYYSHLQVYPDVGSPPDEKTIAKGIKALEEFEKQYFPDMDSGKEPSGEEYLLRLKDNYKKNHKLLLASA